MKKQTETHLRFPCGESHRHRFLHGKWRPVLDSGRHMEGVRERKVNNYGMGNFSNGLYVFGTGSGGRWKLHSCDCTDCSFGDRGVSVRKDTKKKEIGKYTKGDLVFCTPISQRY